jgi:hypothetical protein
MDFKTWAIAADPHGDQIEPKVAIKFFDWLDDYKPQIRINLGDNWNFDALRTGASDADRAVSLSEDIEAGMNFNELFFSGGEKNIFLRGNHDERLWKLLHDPCSGLARSFATDLTRRIGKELRLMNVRMLPYDADKGVYALGKLKCLHGYAHGMHAAREHARVYGQHSVFGHVHRFDYASLPSHGGPRTSRSIGCLAKTRLSYCANKIHPLAWQQGWAYGIVYPNGNYTFNEAIIQPSGQVILATGFKIF